MFGPEVLKIVVENSVLDLLTINNTIRSLSKAFREIGDNAMVEHESFKQGLHKVNSQFKFHYCILCEKPHVRDGSWEGPLCACRLDGPSSSDAAVAREIHRRTNLGKVGDPRMEPIFAGLSSKAKLIRLVQFRTSFAKDVMMVILSSGWFYRMSAFPLFPLHLEAVFKQYNESGFQDLSICMYVDILQKEFRSTGRNCTNLLDIALQYLAADPSEVEHYQQLLDNDEACLTTFLGSDDGAGDRFCKAIRESFFKILGLNSANDALFLDLLKNLGNSVGTFLTERQYDASLFLEEDHIQSILRSLPETFVWMPIYGGRPEDYVPPVNRFASHAATRENEGASSAGHQEE